MLLDPLIIAFFGIALGFAFQKFIGFDQKTAADLLIYITAPALIFSAIYSREIILEHFFLLGLAALLVMLASGIFAWIAFRLLKYGNSGMLLPAMFMNSGYLGYPVALFALGEIGLQNAIIFDAFETALIFSIGVFLVQKTGVRKREKLAAIFRLPLIYAIVLGAALNLAHVWLPELFVSSLSFIGSATIPLALLALGGRLAQLKIGSLKIPFVSVFARLAIGGIAGFAFIKLLNVEGTVASVILLLSVMPPAVNSYVLNEKFRKDADNAATAVVLGTVLSVIPIALVLALI